MHEIIRMVDVLPAPLGPRKPNDSPLAMVKSTPSTATKSPKRLTSPWASTIGGRARVPPAPVPVGSESGTSVIGEECDVIVRERYRAAQGPNASGRTRRWLGKDWGGHSRPGSRGALRRPPTRLRAGNTNNDWWAFEHTPGSGCAEPSGDCCDSWNRWEEDADLVAGARARQLPLLGGVEPH